jgi:hypothetical protein
MSFLRGHKTPQLVELACPHVQVAPQGEHDSAAVARDPIEPGAERVFVHLDDPSFGT